MRVSDREKRKILKMMMSGDRRQRDKETERAHLRERTTPESDQREREALPLRIENEKSERLGLVLFFIFFLLLPPGSSTSFFLFSPLFLGFLAFPATIF